MERQRYIEDLSLELDQLKNRSLLRETRALDLGVDFTSNDYLGLKSREFSSVPQMPILGAGASRVLSGTYQPHLNLESVIADYVGTESALFFGSGYLANLGTLSALIGRNDVVLSDKYSHRSLLEGIRLSGARHFRFRHNDLDHLRVLLEREVLRRKPDQNIFVVTESVFSMDGDLAPLAKMAELCGETGALLIVDEAHAIGVFGSGICSQENILDQTLAVLGTCSKSFSGYGGFFAGSKTIREYLVNKASSFIYSTALPPSLCEVLIHNIKFIGDSKSLGEKALDNASFFRAQLSGKGVYNYCPSQIESSSHIVPLVLGEEDKVLKLKNLLFKEGISIAPIRPPTVPINTSRIRFSIRADHDREDLMRVTLLVTDAVKAL